MARFAANLDWLFTDRPLPERFAAAARAGFGAVELIFAHDHDPDAIAEGLARHGLALALINVDPGDWAAGERGFAAVPGAEARFETALERTLALAERLGPERIHVLAGIAEGSEARATYLRNLRLACARAPDRRFTIEPINRRDMPGYHLWRSADAAAVIEAVGAPNLGLQLDLYHTELTEGDPVAAIRALGPLIAHVQVAGVPDRHEPEPGILAAALAALGEAGYGGWIAAEYRPAGRTEDGLGWLARMGGQAAQIREEEGSG